MDLRRASNWYARGSIELPVQEALVGNLAPGGVLYDIGANAGFFSLLGARTVGESGRVYAFEPVPANAGAILRNAALNRFGMIEVIEAAVAAEPGRAELVLDEHPGGAALASAGSVVTPAGRIEVELVSIDALVESGAIRPPTLVKIDVEGAEDAVLDGLVRTVEAHRPAIIIELDDATPDKLEPKLAHARARLESMGYAVEPIADAYPDIAWCVGHLLAR